jgi:hypothetical protein
MDDPMPDSDGRRAAQVLSEPVGDNGNDTAVVAGLGCIERRVLGLVIGEVSSGKGRVHAYPVEEAPRRLGKLVPTFHRARDSVDGELEAQGPRIARSACCSAGPIAPYGCRGGTGTGTMSRRRIESSDPWARQKSMSAQTNSTSRGVTALPVGRQSTRSASWSVMGSRTPR